MLSQQRYSDKTIFVTGGAGFIGSNFVLEWLAKNRGRVVNLDKLTYAGNLNNLESIISDPRHLFVQGDIADSTFLRGLYLKYSPAAVINFAAESHVDRSIHGPEDFIQTNVVGTLRLLEETRAYWQGLSVSDAQDFRFLHVSTDEVYGTLDPSDPPFTETTAYAPNSPYAASKAASDHLVRAYHHTYRLPTLTTHCSNNYGPYQFPEKLLPLLIANATQGKALPIYGDGANIRDWLYVSDHCDAISVVLAHGKVGETYNIGGNAEHRNIDVVHAVCTILDELHPDSPVIPHAKLISFVKDRPGHDRRYAIDASKIRAELGWIPRVQFIEGLRQTVQWYLQHPDWVAQVTSGDYRHWVNKNYEARSKA
ncbi:MAG: dTDP-glucose 4,6-dehydratase [Gammaproteobacteria bacterium]|nr:dTDP-glucose 4,6-dehydratase [Gammaproteobacteria bacterium]